MKICSLRLSPLLVSLFITFILCSGCRKLAPEKPTVTDLTVADLVKAYETDAQAADTTYKGRTLTVSGRVESVLPIGPPSVGSLKDLSGQPLIFMENQRVACTFATGQYESAKPKAGQDVILSCRCDGKYGARIVLKDCVFK